MPVYDQTAALAAFSSLATMPLGSLFFLTGDNVLYLRAGSTGDFADLRTLASVMEFDKAAAASAFVTANSVKKGSLGYNRDTNELLYYNGTAFVGVGGGGGGGGGGASSAVTAQVLHPPMTTLANANAAITALGATVEQGTLVYNTETESLFVNTTQGFVAVATLPSNVVVQTSIRNQDSGFSFTSDEWNVLGMSGNVTQVRCDKPFQANNIKCENGMTITAEYGGSQGFRFVNADVKAPNLLATDGIGFRYEHEYSYNTHVVGAAVDMAANGRILFDTQFVIAAGGKRTFQFPTNASPNDIFVCSFLSGPFYGQMDDIIVSAWRDNTTNRITLWNMGATALDLNSRAVLSYASIRQGTDTVPPP